MSKPTKDLSWEDACIEVLKRAKSAMHYTDIATAITSGGLRRKFGATPAASVSTAICVSLKKDGDASPFMKVGVGEYMLRSIPTTGGTGTRTWKDGDVEDGDAAEGGGIIQAFGMFWRREMVSWKKDPEILGEQQQGATVVDFCAQRGVYLLHDGREIIYVGRAIDQAIGNRLFQHISDRLSTRWDRFSWFGLKPVTDDGKLLEASFGQITQEVVIATLEAVLIEGLEPRQNRKRGDEFRAVEYIQSEDPQIQRKRMQSLLSELQKKIDG
jgi:hypothetical protein